MVARVPAAGDRARPIVLDEDDEEEKKMATPPSPAARRDSRAAAARQESLYPNPHPRCNKNDLWTLEVVGAELIDGGVLIESSTPDVFNPLPSSPIA